MYTNVDLNTDQCVIPFSENVLDLARPPVNCSFCKGKFSMLKKDASSVVDLTNFRVLPADRE